MTQLQVFHIAPSLGVGGLERMLVDFARRHDRARYLPTVVSINDKGVLGPEIEATGTEVIALGKAGGLRPGTVFELSRLLKARRADVVHTHNNSGLIYGAAAARLAGVRCIVHTRHGVEPESGRLARATPAIARLAHRVVCVSADNRDLALASGIPDGRLVTILNGVDLGRFDYAGPTAAGPIVTVARLSPEKDLATLLRAMALLKDTAPDLRLEIAGEGPCRDELDALSTELSLDDRVTLLGRISDVAGLLTRARMFALSSLTEGVSLTLLEAMGRGLPVVATSVGGNTEVVADGVTGLLVPPSRPDLLAAALSSLAADPHRATEMGRAGRRRVEERFDLGRTIAEYERLYETILAGNTFSRVG